MSEAPGQVSGSTTLTAWNFHTMHVQTNQLEATAISAESTLLAGGPPMLEQLRETDPGPTVLTEGGLQTGPNAGAPNTTPEFSSRSDVLLPMGLVEQFTIQQNKQQQQIFEIGSARSYIIPGRVIQTMSIGRIFFNGPSLLRVLYGAYKDAGRMPNFEAGTEAVQVSYAVDLPAGYGQFLINLGSDLFNQPFGLGVFHRDQMSRWYGAYYCEYAHVQGYTMSMSAGSSLLVEGTTAKFDTIRPIDITGVKNSSDRFKLTSPPAVSVGAIP